MEGMRLKLQKQNKEEKKNKLNLLSGRKKRIIAITVSIAILMYIFYTIYLLIKQPTGVFTIEEGKLYKEETSIGYVIRNEKFVKVEN